MKCFQIIRAAWGSPVAFFLKWWIISSGVLWIMISLILFLEFHW